MSLLLLTGCQSQSNPPAMVEQPEVNLLAIFPTDEPDPIVVGVVTRLPTLTPTALSAETPPPATVNLFEPAPTVLPTPTLVPVPCLEPGRIEWGTYISRVQGPSRNYRIYLPPCYGQDSRVYPTLYILHGNLRGEEEWDVIGLDDSAEILINANTLPPMIIVMPDGRSISDISSGGPLSYEDVIINELIPAIESSYCAGADKSLRAIGGLSRGGYWSFEIAFRNPDLFESAASHSGSFLDSSDDVTINPLYTASRNDLGNLRIAMDYGADDWSRNTGLSLHQDLLDAGIPHRWDDHPTGGHDDLYWRTHLESYLLWYAEAWSLDRTAYQDCSNP